MKNNCVVVDLSPQSDLGFHVTYRRKWPHVKFVIPSQRRKRCSFHEILWDHVGTQCMVNLFAWSGCSLHLFVLDMAWLNANSSAVHTSLKSGFRGFMMMLTLLVINVAKPRLHTSICFGHALPHAPSGKKSLTRFQFVLKLDLNQQRSQHCLGLCHLLCCFQNVGLTLWHLLPHKQDAWFYCGGNLLHPPHSPHGLRTFHILIC